MFSSEAHVKTSNASRYLIQLCKHFAHKIDVKYDAKEGLAKFPFGTCTMHASDTHLALHCTGNDEAALERVQDILQKHLEGFAFREKPEISWVRL